MGCIFNLKPCCVQSQPTAYLEAAQLCLLYCSWGVKGDSTPAQTRKSQTPSSIPPSVSGKKSYQGVNVCENQVFGLAERILPQSTIQLSRSCISYLHYKWNSGRCELEAKSGGPSILA